MLTRALTTLTLLLALSGRSDRVIPATADADRAPAAHRAPPFDDDLGGCREPAPAPVPVAVAACSDEVPQ
jgi:hypothetical protein